MRPAFKVFLVILLSFILGLILSFPQIHYLVSNIDEEYINEINSYSKQIQGLIGWEKDNDFKKICLEHQIIWRMAAFQMIFPDILPEEQHNVDLAVKLLKGKVIYPGKIFSMNQSVGPYSKFKGFKNGRSYQGTRVIKVPGGGVCKIASALYNLAVLANLPIIARKNHGMLVSYVSPGRDAAVSSYGLDFKFKNNTEYPIIIWCKMVGNQLFIALYGRNKPPEVIWHQKIVQTQKFQTIYQYNSKLKKGEEKVIIPGTPGVTVKSWLIIKYSNGKVQEKSLGLDYYKPMPRIIEYGPK